MHMAATWARYAALTDDAWAREIARRQSILTTYDAHETGVVEDRIRGGVDGDPASGSIWPIRGRSGRSWRWSPGSRRLFGPARENHIMRSSSVVRDVRYGKGRITYSTFDALAPCEDVLRLAFRPPRSRPTASRSQLGTSRRENGYTVKPLPSGDFLVTIRHDGCRDIVVEGDDPQETFGTIGSSMKDRGRWKISPALGRQSPRRFAGRRGRGCDFHGNQVRLVGRADPSGGKADVYLDGVKQLCGIDFWCPRPAINRSSATRTA